MGTGNLECRTSIEHKIYYVILICNDLSLVGSFEWTLGTQPF